MSSRESRPQTVAGIAILLLLLSCDGAERPSSEAPPTPAPRAAAPGADVRFTEVAADVGLDFVHGTGAFGQKWLPETMGSGCAWFDFDGDGDPDALLLSGSDWPGHPTGQRQMLGLFRNDGGSFTEVTVEAGLDAPLHAMGVTVGDYDEDGDRDLYVTAVGPNRLYRNDGGRFTDVAEGLGLADAGFGSSAAWLDHDRDGDLDLLLLNYVEWSPEADVTCTLDGHVKSYCTPESYGGASPRLYRNDGGRFTDVSAAAGVHDPSAKGLGLAVLDYDDDGWDDVVIANDTRPNTLLHSERDGTFTSQGVLAGVAFDHGGHARGAMGIDAGDFDGSGTVDIVIGNFANEMVSLYRNAGARRFVDVAPESGVGPESLRTLAFGTFLFDCDLDGRLDIFVANGHLDPEIQSVQPQVSYAQPCHLFRNLGGGQFEDSAPASPALSQPVVARGAAYADFDGDGDLDILLNVLGGPARLLRNDSTPAGHSLRIQLVGGHGSSRDAYGAKVVVSAGPLVQVAWLRSTHSYCSQSERVLTFGLAAATTADEVLVTWPSGKHSRLRGVPAGATLLIREADAN